MHEPAQAAPSAAMKYDARALKRLREAAGLRIDALADQAGMSENTLRLIERGVSIPRADSIARLATALGVAVAEFFVDGDGQA